MPLVGSTSTYDHRRLSSREYARFFQFLMTQPEGVRLLAAFRDILLSKFDDAHYPSSPVDPPGESFPAFPAQNHGDSDSSVEDIWEYTWDEDPGHGALQVEELAGAVAGAGVGHGCAGGPAGYKVVVEILAGDVAEAADHSIDGGEISDDDIFDMEPLF